MDKQHNVTLVNMSLQYLSKVVSPPLGWSPLSSFLVLWSPSGDSRGPSVVFEALDIPCPGPFQFSQSVDYIGPTGYIITIIVTFLYSELQRQTFMQHTHSPTELDTMPPPPAWKCPLGKFRSSLLHGACQMHRFRRHTT